MTDKEEEEKERGICESYCDPETWQQNLPTVTINKWYVEGWENYECCIGNDLKRKKKTCIKSSLLRGSSGYWWVTQISPEKCNAENNEVPEE